MSQQAKNTVQYLFKVYMEKQEFLTDELKKRLTQTLKVKNEEKKARVIADYIAGMTDRFAISEFERTRLNR